MLITAGILTAFAALHIVSRRRTVAVTPTKLDLKTRRKAEWSKCSSVANVDPSSALTSWEPSGVAEAAKGLFISLQAANDQADLPTLRAGLSHELFNIVRRDIEARGTSRACVEIRGLSAEVLRLRPKKQQCDVSIWFTCRMLHPVTRAAFELDEVWQITATRDSPIKWTVTGIQLN